MVLSVMGCAGVSVSVRQNTGFVDYVKYLKLIAWNVRRLLSSHHSPLRGRPPALWFALVD